MNKTEEVMDRVGFRIEFMRKVRGLSMNQLATKVGVTKQSVNKWESAQMSIPITRLYSISEALNVQIEFFFVPHPMISLGGNEMKILLSDNPS